MFKSHVEQQYGEQIQYLKKLQAKLLQNDPWVRKKITIMQRQNLSADEASTGAIGGEVGLAFFFFILLVPLISTPTFDLT
jgi:cytochrome c-type biogenesis protein CcmH/NrfG